MITLALSLTRKFEYNFHRDNSKQPPPLMAISLPQEKPEGCCLGFLLVMAGTSTLAIRPTTWECCVTRYLHQSKHGGSVESFLLASPRGDETLPRGAEGL